MNEIYNAIQDFVKIDATVSKSHICCLKDFEYDVFLATFSFVG